MSKYGSGVSMKSAIQMEIDEIKSILHPYDIDKDDLSEVLNIVKEMAYQWCTSNAAGRTVDEWMKDNVSEEQYNKYVTLLIPNGRHMNKYYETYEKVIQETYPFDDEPLEDE